MERARRATSSRASVFAACSGSNARAKERFAAWMLPKCRLWLVIHRGMFRWDMTSIRERRQYKHAKQKNYHARKARAERNEGAFALFRRRDGTRRAGAHPGTRAAHHGKAKDNARKPCGRCAFRATRSKGPSSRGVRGAPGGERQGRRAEICTRRLAISGSVSESAASTLRRALGCPQEARIAESREHSTHPPADDSRAPDSFAKRFQTSGSSGMIRIQHSGCSLDSELL